MYGAGHMMDFNNRMNELRSGKKRRSSIKLKSPLRHSKDYRELRLRYRKAADKEGIELKRATSAELLKIRSLVLERNKTERLKVILSIVIAVAVTAAICFWINSAIELKILD